MSCHGCGQRYELDEFGSPHNLNGETIFSGVTDWNDCQKECLEREIEEGNYLIDVDVGIYAMKDMKALHRLGEGHLRHTMNGFSLIGLGGELAYRRNNKASSSLYSDFYWYELGDMICLGDKEARYYRIIKDGSDVASKARLASEILFPDRVDPYPHFPPTGFCPLSPWLHETLSIPSILL